MNELRIQHLTKSFPTPAEELVVLKDLSLEMSASEQLAVVGPSGTGKSTLLHLLGTLDRPTSGKIELLGTDPFTLSPEALARFRNQHIGFVFQDHYLLPQLNVLQNVLIPALAAGSVSDAHLARGQELLERVGLADRATHLPRELSGGERGRAAVARALLLKPSLILADEPTGNLDQANAERITDLLIELPKHDRSMLIVVTHSDRVAERLQRTLRLSK